MFWCSMGFHYSLLIYCTLAFVFHLFILILTLTLALTLTLTLTSSWLLAIPSVEEAFGALAKGKVDVPMPMHIGIEESENAGPGK